MIQWSSPKPQNGDWRIGRGEKVKIVKFRRRKHYRKQQGHRQWFTDVKITGISA